MVTTLLNSQRVGADVDLTNPGEKSDGHQSLFLCNLTVSQMRSEKKTFFK